MRPPVLPSGNTRAPALRWRLDVARFNEAAGFTQRKPAEPLTIPGPLTVASMRPPVLPSGNAAYRRSGSGDGQTLQ